MHTQQTQTSRTKRRQDARQNPERVDRVAENVMTCNMCASTALTEPL
jgi:hypothetical protein